MASACGKCILFGEHSILEGGSAIALPITDLKLTIHFEPGSKNKLELQTDLQGYADIAPQAEDLLWTLLKRDFADCKTRGNYVIESAIPLGAGLGSSAALTVALNRQFRPNIPLDEMIRRAWQSENLFHGKSSGLDPTTITLEKPIYFRTPMSYSELRVPVSLKKDYVFVLHDSGVRRSTHQTISSAQKLRERERATWEKTIRALQEIVNTAKETFEAGIGPDLAAHMNQAHESLRILGFSNPALEDLRNNLITEGALGAKLTGAGLGGFVLSLFELNRWREFFTRLQSGNDPKFSYRFLNCGFNNLISVAIFTAKRAST